MRSSSLAKVQHEAAGKGFNLLGLVDAARYDACQPKEQRVRHLAPSCGTVLVLATGGRTFWQRYLEVTGGRDTDLDGRCFSNEGVRAIADTLAAESIPHRAVPRNSVRLSFARLAEAAGFGTISPVSGLFLHPQFGPWVGVRAAFLIDGTPFGPIPDASITERFHPCCTCHRPCIAACPANVHDGEGHQDLARCASHRHEGNCASACKSRLACPVGSEHRDAPGENAHCHEHSLRELQRRFGLGVWRLVPWFFRRRS